MSLQPPCPVPTEIQTMREHPRENAGSSKHEKEGSNSLAFSQDPPTAPTNCIKVK